MVALVVFDSELRVSSSSTFPSDCYFGSTVAPFPSAVLYQAVQSISDFEQDEYSDSMDIQQLWDNKPASTSHLKKYSTAPYVHLTPTPTPPSMNETHRDGQEEVRLEDVQA